MNLLHTTSQVGKIARATNQVLRSVAPSIYNYFSGHQNGVQVALLFEI